MHFVFSVKSKSFHIQKVGRSSCIQCINLFKTSSTCMNKIVQNFEVKFTNLQYKNHFSRKKINLMAAFKYEVGTKAHWIQFKRKNWCLKFVFVLDPGEEVECVGEYGVLVRGKVRERYIGTDGSNIYALDFPEGLNRLLYILISN